MNAINPRTAPNSNESEQSVLGGLLAHEDKWDDIVTIIGAEDFYYKQNSLIFAAIKILKDHKIYHQKNYFWLNKILNKIIN